MVRWKPDGTWLYEDNTVKENLAVGVPLADGNLADIEHLPVMSAVKTLGSMMCPAGLVKAAIERMQSQGQEVWCMPMWVKMLPHITPP